MAVAKLNAEAASAQVEIESTEESLRVHSEMNRDAEMTIVQRDHPHHEVFVLATNTEGAGIEAQNATLVVDEVDRDRPMLEMDAIEVVALGIETQMMRQIYPFYGGSQGTYQTCR